jgi:hypothetical protein
MYCGGGEQLAAILITYFCRYLMPLKIYEKILAGLGGLKKNINGQSQNSQLPKTYKGI